MSMYKTAPTAHRASFSQSQSGVMSPRLSTTSTSMNLDEMNIKTWILNTSLIENVTYYRILVRRGATSVIQETKRRYNEFLDFRDAILDVFETMPTCPRCMTIAKVVAGFDFPKKHYFSARSKVVVNYRMQAFRNFISMIVTKVFNPSPKCSTCAGKLVTVVLRFLLQNATILPENQVPRDGMRSAETPKSTRSDAGATGFHNFPRSTSAPMSSLRGMIGTPKASVAAPQSAPGGLAALPPSTAAAAAAASTAPVPEKYKAMHRYSVPQEEQEDMYDDFDDYVKPLARPEAMFDSFMHDKDSVKDSRGLSMSATSDVANEAPVPEGDGTSESSDDEDEIEMTGVFHTSK
ncbi:Aste57867_21054 [Aphanomyces stellatus]|uniref:Aste57867_21054 protein n=1 Tax=Aphanomyces stellatus TaxID=120398 RepID=A0A485LL81_9STRA|nr:hypothetical protein As57867_020986 [Aphanomyces stellatus]VFT97729.1 Aste57867_21054 [Aphanomyces stellatus]